MKQKTFQEYKTFHDKGYKRISQNIDLEIFAEHREFEETEHFKEVQKVRPQIEQRNAHLKNRYGLDKTYGTGLLSMKAQSTCRQLQQT